MSLAIIYKEIVTRNKRNQRLGRIAKALLLTLENIFPHQQWTIKCRPGMCKTTNGTQIANKCRKCGHGSKTAFIIANTHGSSKRHICRHATGFSVGTQLDSASARNWIQRRHATGFSVGMQLDSASACNWIQRRHATGFSVGMQLDSASACYWIQRCQWPFTKALTARRLHNPN